MQHDELLPVSLGSWPTPLEPAPRLARALGLYPDDLWIKRDDLTGLGTGGNKVRKLEYTCALARINGADTLVTTGAAQSNHARLTAAAGARLGLDVVLVLAGDPPPPTGNLLLDALFGAQLRWAGPVGHDAQDDLAAEVAAELTATGSIVEILPYGGSSVLGARGYVDCALELLDQEPDLNHVVVAVGSGGTMAGLAHGLGGRRVLGVDTGAVNDPLGAVRSLLAGLQAEPWTGGLNIRSDQVGAGYSALTPGVRDALWLAAHTEGVVLDPIYTGRALAGLRAAVGDGTVRPGDRTVLLHSGGLPGLFGNAETVEYLRWMGQPR